MAKFDFLGIDQIVQVCVPSCEYPIIIGRDILKNRLLLRHYVPAKQVFIVTDNNVAPYYLDEISQAFSDRQCDSYLLPTGEENKNYQSISPLYDKLISQNFHRDTTLIALGGGVVGDLTGFVASTYMRGVTFVQIPTTLIGQVDSAIGGKTAINHRQAKNVIGSFYQPNLVMSDLNTLTTLPAREFRSGYAEIIKYALLAGGDFFDFVYQFFRNENLDKQTVKDFHGPLSSIIQSCCQIKAKLIQADEEDKSGQRALLNLGHTIAHALEAYTHYKRWLHGEAVGIGLYCAALLSQIKSNLSDAVILKLDEMLVKAKLPNRIPKDVSLDDICQLLWKDKKIKNGKLRFVLLKSPGNCYLDETVSMDLLIKVLKNAVA